MARAAVGLLRSGRHRDRQGPLRVEVTEVNVT